MTIISLQIKRVAHHDNSETFDPIAPSDDKVASDTVADTISIDMDKNIIKLFTGYRNRVTVPLGSATPDVHHLAINEVDSLSIDIEMDKKIRTFTSYHHRGNPTVSRGSATPDSHRFANKVFPDPIVEAPLSSSSNTNKKLIKTFTGYHNRSNDALSLEPFTTDCHRLAINKVVPELIAEASSSTNMIKK